MNLIQYIIITIISVLISGCERETSRQTSGNIEKNVPLYDISYSTDTSYCHFIQGIASTNNSINLDFDTISKEYKCDINFEEYLKLFDQLKIRKNWEINSYYRHFEDAGRIVLLGFEKDNPYSDSILRELSKTNTTKEYKHSEDYPLSQKLFAYNDSINHLKAIEIRDNKMGYLQYVTLHLIGDNYCSYWHSNYGEISLICSENQLEELVERQNDKYYRFTSRQESSQKTDNDFEFSIVMPNSVMVKEDVLAINPSPTIEINNSEAIVKVVTLSPWSGFRRRTFEISRKWPHKITQTQLDTIIEYNCGILF